MIILKRLLFAGSALIYLLFLFCFLLVETVLLFLWYIPTGKGAGLSEKINKKVFSYIEERFKTIGEYTYE